MFGEDEKNKKNCCGWFQSIFIILLRGGWIKGSLPLGFTKTQQHQESPPNILFNSMLVSLRLPFHLLPSNCPLVMDCELGKELFFRGTHLRRGEQTSFPPECNLSLWEVHKAKYPLTWAENTYIEPKGARKIRTLNTELRLPYKSDKALEKNK